jgi:hypothetical protein
MGTKFFLVLSLTSPPMRYELTAAVSGDADGWNGTTRYYTTRNEVETALRDARVLAPVGPNQSLDAVASNIPVAFALASATPAIALQVLRRVDPEAKHEKTMVTFNDLNGSFPYSTAHYEREHRIAVGEVLEVETPMGRRNVEVLAITKDEVVPYGSDDTRRHVSINVRF